MGREVYTSNEQLGGPDVMGPNGVSHQLVESHVGAVTNALRWLSFVPRLRGSDLPVVSAMHLAVLHTRQVHTMAERACLAPLFYWPAVGTKESAIRALSRSCTRAYGACPGMQPRYGSGFVAKFCGDHYTVDIAPGMDVFVRFPCTRLCVLL